MERERALGFLERQDSREKNERNVLRELEGKNQLRKEWKETFQAKQGKRSSIQSRYDCNLFYIFSLQTFFYPIYC